MGPSYKPLLVSYKKFIEKFSWDITKVNYSDECGYFLKDALFDIAILSYEEQIQDKNIKYLWEKTADEMGDRATNAWNKICELTETRVKQLLGD